MVRKVDTDSPLSYEEFIYLRDRSRLPDAYTLDPNDSRFSEDDRQYASQAESRARASQVVEDDETSWEDAAGDDIEEMNVPELRDALEQRDLSTSGNKAELVERLKSYGD